ncbi:MAG TPA: hypothetical protein VF840_13380 [Terriglobales bacterium]
MSECKSVQQQITQSANSPGEFPQLFSTTFFQRAGTRSTLPSATSLRKRVKSNRGRLNQISGFAVAVKVRGGDGNRAMLIFTGKTRFAVEGETGMHFSGEVTKVLFKNIL